MTDTSSSSSPPDLVGAAFGAGTQWSDLTPGQRAWFVNTYAPSVGQIPQGTVNLFDTSPPQFTPDGGPISSTVAAANDAAAAPAAAPASPWRWALPVIAGIFVLGMARRG